MGFNLELFLEELNMLIQSGATKQELLDFVKKEKEYAKQCGVL